MYKDNQSEVFFSDRNYQAIRQNAFHQAGHVAAIFFNNRHFGLPPIHFQIVIQSRTGCFDISSGNTNRHIQIIGGRIIDPLSISIKECSHHLSLADRSDFLKALEADIINSLAGPIAEARYVSIRDNEPLNPQMLNFSSLAFYNGSHCNEIINDYLQCIDEGDQRELKKTALFQTAYQFVSSRSNWNSISGLAEHILNSRTNKIDYEIITEILENKSSESLKNGSYPFENKTFHHN